MYEIAAKPQPKTPKTSAIVFVASIETSAGVGLTNQRGWLRWTFERNQGGWPGLTLTPSGVTVSGRRPQSRLPVSLFSCVLDSVIHCAKSLGRSSEGGTPPERAVTPCLRLCIARGFTYFFLGNACAFIHRSSHIVRSPPMYFSRQRFCCRLFVSRCFVCYGRGLFLFFAVELCRVFLLSTYQLWTCGLQRKISPFLKTRFIFSFSLLLRFLVSRTRTWLCNRNPDNLPNKLSCCIIFL